MDPKYNAILLRSGLFFILLSFGFISWIYIFQKDDWKLHITGLNKIKESEIRSIIRYTWENSPVPLTSTDLSEVLSLNPRIESAQVTILGKKVKVHIIENQVSYLWHNSPDFSEVSVNEKILQEKIVEKSGLSSDLPIFYLTASNDNEITLTKRDIIHVKEKTVPMYAAIWKKISEFQIDRNNYGQLEIRIFHSELPVTISVYERFTLQTFRKLWAVLDYLEENHPAKPVQIRIFGDHAALI